MADPKLIGLMDRLRARVQHEIDCGREMFAADLLSAIGRIKAAEHAITITERERDEMAEALLDLANNEHCACSIPCARCKVSIEQSRALLAKVEELDR